MEGRTIGGMLHFLADSLRALGGASSKGSRNADPAASEFSDLGALLDDETPSKHMPWRSTSAHGHQRSACTPSGSDHCDHTPGGIGISQSVRIAPKGVGHSTSTSTKSIRLLRGDSASSTTIRMLRGDSASSTTISLATCPVATANLCIQQDLHTLGKALAQLLRQIKGGNPLGYWQVDALRTRFGVMHKLARDVHRHEEESLFPLVRSHNVRLCKTMQCQNTDVIMLWSNLRRTVSALRMTHDCAADFESVRDIAVAYTELQVAVRAHWEQVDTKLLPTLQKACSEQELADSDTRLLQDPTLQDWAHFLSLQPDEAAKKAMMKHMGASRITSVLVLMRGARLYAKLVGPLFQDLKNGCPGKGRSKQIQCGSSFLSGLGF